MTDVDLLVVGGGIHGCGAAQAAAAAGYSVVLVEQTGLAHGTSSRSSKLIHGGLRYLERLELGLVRECLHERRLLLRLAPKLVELRDCHIPIYPQSARPAWKIRVGLSLYAALAGFRKSARFKTLPRESWNTLDGLETEGLQEVFRYRDAQTDDRRLTRAVMAAAVRLGAELKCPARMIDAELSRDAITATLDGDGHTERVRARAMVNAAGPWINRVLDRVHPKPPAREVDLVRGSHVLLPGELSKGIYYVEAPGDRRPVFVMPWEKHTLVGTTEAIFEGDPERVEPVQSEIDYLLSVYTHYFPGSSTEEIGRFAGLRVLPPGRRPANERSRETILHTDREHRPRVLSIYGGKLTSYRATAEAVVDRLGDSLPKRRRRARTQDMRLEPADEL